MEDNLLEKHRRLLGRNFQDKFRGGLGRFRLSDVAVRDEYVVGAAKAFIWALFLLIIVPTVAMANVKFGMPLRPVFFFAVIAGGLAASAVLVDPRLSSFRGARTFFVAFAVAVALGVIMYRGENVGPDFGGIVMDQIDRPSSLGYAVWPALNLVAGLGIYLLAGQEIFRRTIVVAAFVTLTLQAITMEADMWWPAIFGDKHGRAGGIAQNANDAALLISVLASLTLPSRIGERFNIYAPSAILIMIPVVLLSQSRAGGIDMAICLFGFAVSASKGVMRWPSPFLSAALLTVFGCTLWFSPILHPSSKQIGLWEENRVAIAESDTNVGELAGTTLDEPLSLSERLKSRISIDLSAGYRRDAVIFFLGVLKEAPFGLGTGFTNKFQTGPHNSFLKLAVDEGIFAAICLVVMLIAATERAWRLLSPQLLSICAIAWVGSMFYHTIMVEPLIPIALAIGLGMAGGRSQVCS